MVEKSVQHRVVGKINYTPVATIPTKKVQKNVKVAPPKEGGCGDRGNPKTEPYCLVFISDAQDTIKVRVLTRGFTETSWNISINTTWRISRDPYNRPAD